MKNLYPIRLEWLGLPGLILIDLFSSRYDIDEVEITVGTTYEAVGEALVADTADVGLIPGGTYRTLCFLRFKNLVSPNT